MQENFVAFRENFLYIIASETWCGKQTQQNEDVMNKQTEENFKEISNWLERTKVYPLTEKYIEMAKNSISALSDIKEEFSLLEARNEDMNNICRSLLYTDLINIEECNARKNKKKVKILKKALNRLAEQYEYLAEERENYCCKDDCPAFPWCATDGLDRCKDTIKAWAKGKYDAE
jgi:hypothetical protein